MNNSLLLKIFALAAGLAVGVSLVTAINEKSLSSQMAIYESEYLQSSQSYGSTLPFAGNTYNLAGSGVSSSATSFTLTSLTIKQTGQPIQDSDLGDTFYITLEPGSNTKQEIIACTTVGANTGSTVTISGCTRGLSPITPYTASTTLQFTHGGGSQVIFSDPPQLFNLYYALANVATSTNVLTFSSTTPPRYDYTAAQSTGTYISTTSELASIDYVNKVALVSAPNASAGAKGVLQLPTARQAASSTLLGSTGASMALQTAIATDTPQNCTITGSLLGGCVIMSDLGGKLKQAWLDLTQPFVTTGQWTFSNLFATNASSSNATTTNTIYYAGKLMQTPKFGGTGVDGALSISSGITTINIGGANIVEKNYTSISITGTGSLYFNAQGATSTAGVTVILRSQGDCTFTSSAASVIDVRGLGGGMGNAHATNGGPVSSTNPGGAGGGSVGGFGSDSSESQSSALSAVGVGGVMLPQLASSTRMASPGGNGAAGQTSGSGGPAGVAGYGSGAIVIECGGTYSFTTGTFNLSGQNGGAGGAGGGNPGGSGGGGGGAGSMLVIYKAIGSDSGTYTVTAGSGGGGGSGTNAGQAGSAGAAGATLRIPNNYWY